MQIKKYEAPTIQEALETIKRELGPEAIILQTKRNKKGFGLLNGSSIEVTAAISDRSLQKKSYLEKKLEEAQIKPFYQLSTSQQADLLDYTVNQHSSRKRTPSEKTTSDDGIKQTSMKYVDIDPEDRPHYHSPKLGKEKSSLEDEVNYLKRMIEELKMAQNELTSGTLATQITTQILKIPALLDAFEGLILSGIDRKYALGLVRKVAYELGESRSEDPELVLDQVTFELMNATEIMSPLSTLKPRSEEPENDNPQRMPLCLALIGPTGVGKTTTLAKIASEAVMKRSLRVGVINLDTFKVAAVDQLATYAKILSIPFRSATSQEELKTAIHDFKSLDLVLIDTTGRSQRDVKSLRLIHQLLTSLETSVQPHLVVSASTRDTELYDTANRFSLFKPQGLIFSKLDEASLFGSIHNLSQRAKLPLSYFTTGQRVPEDIEEATGERLAALIMDL